MAAGTDLALARALIAAVQACDFGATPDRRRGGAAVAHFPSLDLALVVFPPGRPACWANVLFSREHPLGVIAGIDARAGAPANLRFDADLQDAQGESIAWAPDADWQALRWTPLSGLADRSDPADLAGPGAGGRLRFVAPYPASLLKLMVAIGVGLALDHGRIAAWPAALEPMIVTSDNDATTELVALLHRSGMIGPLQRRLAELGLATLRLQGTQPDGGWRNADGAGVGRIQMTAWDAARLLWLLDGEAPPPPWLAAGTALLRPATREHLRGVLQRQQLDEILSSGSLRGVPGWVPGLPDAPAFAHKTGTTENYASDAGIVRSGSSHYIVALTSSLGRRYAPDDRCATTWRLPALGAALHALVQAISAQPPRPA